MSLMRIYSKYLIEIMNDKEGGKAIMEKYF
jgi:hypothetical protein